MRNKALLLSSLFFLFLFFSSGVEATLVYNVTYNLGTACQSGAMDLGCWYNSTDATYCMFTCKQQSFPYTHFYRINETAQIEENVCEVFSSALYSYKPLNETHGYSSMESPTQRLNLITDTGASACTYARQSVESLPYDFFDIYETDSHLYFSETLNNIRNYTGYLVGEDWEHTNNYEFISFPNRSVNSTYWEMRSEDWSYDDYDWIFLRSNWTNATTRETHIIYDNPQWNISNGWFDVVYITLEDDGFEYLYAISQHQVPQEEYYSIQKFNLSDVIEIGLETPAGDPEPTNIIGEIISGIATALGMDDDAGTSLVWLIISILFGLWIYTLVKDAKAFIFTSVAILLIGWVAEFVSTAYIGILVAVVVILFIYKIGVENRGV